MTQIGSLIITIVDKVDSLRGDFLIQTLDHFKTIVHRFEDRFILKPRGLEFFRRKVEVYFTRGDYEVKTAETPAELAEVLRLRYQVFHKEYKNKKFPFGLDFDDLDFVCDHLIIRSRSTGAIVGNYRLNSSTFSHDFYSAQEFQMDKVLALPGVKLELSRMCIHKDYRNGMVMTLLWRGMVAYMKAVNASTLFGCSSVRTMMNYEIALLYKYFGDQGFLDESFQVHPLPKYQIKKFKGTLSFLENADIHLSHMTAKRLIPPILTSYLRAGARILGEPALDRDYKCTDFFTILNVADIEKVYDRRFQVASE